MCKERHWKLRLLVLLVLGSPAFSHAQSSTCVNADLELGNFSNWTATTGTCCPINSTIPGFMNGRHTIMTGNGTDPNTNGALKVVAPGGTYSARLGNDNVGAQAEQLSYQINVDSGNALFIYRYAVVLEDPSHTSQQQPRFEIRVYDASGLPVGCGTYNVFASSGIPGFVTILNQFGSTVVYKDWTTVGIDLSAYIGQTVTIEFSTGDCKLGGHYGYAYVDCFCSPFIIVNDFCAGASSTTLTAPLGFASYLWSNGATTQSISIQNAVVGNQYQCTMTSVTGCSITLTSVLQTTVVASGYTQGDICKNPIQFYDNSSVVSGSPIVQWHWDFGDGTTSVLQSPVHSYTANGNYTVSLIVTNSGGCSDTIVQNITVGAAPVGGFTSSVVCPGTPTIFTDSSTAVGSSITNWIWNFGDGSAPDSVPDPMHVYGHPGSYPVQLIITDSMGCRDTLLKTVYTLPAPMAGFIRPSACAKELIFFTDTSFTNGTVVSDWIWDFGDGTPLVSAVANPPHVFNQPGSYPIELVVIATNGCSDTAVHSMIVDPLPVVSFLTDTVCLGNNNAFLNSSQIASGSIVNWDWSFGDNSTASSSSPAHSYNAAGTYQVILRATSDKGCVDSALSTAHVWHLPDPDFAIGDPAGCRTHLTNFTDLSTSKDGVIQKHRWDFGNGVKDSQFSPETIYEEAGLFDVSLTVTTNLGCSNDTTKQNAVTVYELPAPSFIYTPDEPTMFLSNVSFFDRSENVLHWWWNFGDSSVSSVQNPHHFYHRTGQYVVTLVVESPEGCRDSTWRFLDVTDSYSFWIPNAFTPDNDGLNDVFTANGFGFTGFSMRIFNRFGELIFTSGTAEVAWDGSYDDTQAPVGVYVYEIKMVDSYGFPHSYNGTVSLLR